MEQKRLLIWVFLSIVILTAWSFFVPQSTTPENNPVQNTPTQPAINPTAPAQTQSPIGEQQSSPTEADVAYPQRLVTITTPLYEVKLDTKGAVPTSWVIKQNKDTGRPITGFDQKPLELISPEGLKRNEAPLRLVTDDAVLDAALANRTYNVTTEGMEAAQSGDFRVELQGNQSRRFDFAMRDAATGLEVTKSFVFSADRYSADLSVKATRGGAQIPRVKLAIGPSIGDQTVAAYTFYSVAPEAVINANQDPVRHHASSIHDDEETRGLLTVNGAVDWAGIGDTYFAMVAIPNSRADRTEYRSVKYEHESNGVEEDRFLITGYIPIATGDALTRLYVGPKDHFILEDVSATLTRDVGREIDLEGLIDYGWFSSISRPLAVPILKAIKFLRELTNSYGLAIIIFTIIIYSLFFPLKWRSSKAMKKAQKLAPQMKELQEKIKSTKPNDPRLKELQMEQLRLMKEGNPLGGCLPLLIQMPFLFALYRAITISIDFRQATFLWLPDLSAADPYHLLPILMAISMLVLQLITPAPSADPLQRKMMAFMMPAMMLWFFWSAPAGLLVYWLVGNIVGFSQQFLINRLTRSGDDQQPPPEKKSKPNKNKKLASPQVSQA